MENSSEMAQTTLSTFASSGRRLSDMSILSAAHIDMSRPRSSASVDFVHSAASLPGSSSTDTSATVYDPSPSSRQPPQPQSANSISSGTDYPFTTSHKIGSAPDPAPPELRPNKAFRYIGYRGFSTFLAADNDALVVRKFGTLHARALLMLQDEIVQLEDKLAEIDRQCEEQEVDEADEYLFHNGSFRGDRLWNTKRDALMNRLVAALEKYDRFVLNYSQLNRQPKAPQRTMNSIRSWLKVFPQAITEYETGFLKEEKEEDLVAMVERRKSHLRRMLESMRLFRHSKRFWMHSRNEYIRNFADPNAIYYKDDKIDITITSIILFLGLFMLLVPSWWLNLAQSHTTRLAIITVFIATFLGLLPLVTPSKPFETMAATAAYGALLMVFMQD